MGVIGVAAALAVVLLAVGIPYPCTNVIADDAPDRLSASRGGQTEMTRHDKQVQNGTFWRDRTTWGA